MEVMRNVAPQNNFLKKLGIFVIKKNNFNF